MKPLLYHEIDNKVEAAKISLGKRDRVPIVAGYKGSQVVVEVSQSDYNSEITPMIQQKLWMQWTRLGMLRV